MADTNLSGPKGRGSRIGPKNRFEQRHTADVRDVFLEWLERTQPDASSRVASRIKAVRDGELSDSRFGKRMRGEGVMADQIEQTFRVFAKKYCLQGDRPALDTSGFNRPRSSSGQLHLF